MSKRADWVPFPEPGEPTISIRIWVSFWAVRVVERLRTVRRVVGVRRRVRRVEVVIIVVDMFDNFWLLPLTAMAVAAVVVMD